VVDMTEEVNKANSGTKPIYKFIKLMKHSKYNVVEEHKKTFAIILLLSLILSSELYRKALQKVLNKAYVPQDINQ
jgi:hypothetical protein